MAAPSSVCKLLSTFKNMQAHPWLQEFLCLGIVECNAHELAKFSDDIKLKLNFLTWEENGERVHFATSLSEIFTKTLLELIQMIEMENYNSPSNLRMAVERLENFRLEISDDGCHLKCLKELKKRCERENDETKMFNGETKETEKSRDEIEDIHKLCEAEIQAVLACHLFSPLLAEGKVILDRQCYKTEVKPECPFCNTKVKTGNTNYGCRELWHGSTDMMINSTDARCVVKVATRDEDGQEEPVTKRAKLENFEDNAENIWSTFVEDGKYLSRLQVLSESDQNVLSDLEESERKALVIKPDKSFIQSISQTIVNAILVAKENKSLENCFIPSFLVTGEFIYINFYNVKEDVLLSQNNPFDIFDDLSIVKQSTVTALWLALNFEICPGDCSYAEKAFYEQYLAKSGFRDFLIKSGTMEKYEKDVEFGFNSAKEPKSKELIKPNTGNFPQRITKIVNMLYEGTNGLS